MSSTNTTPTLSPAFLSALQVEVGILQAKHPVLADVLSRAQALLVDGHVWVEDDGQTATVRSSDGERFYHVNGHCACPASQFRDEPCKHRTALRLYQRVATMLREDEERWTITEPGERARADIPAQYVVLIQQKPFVRFPGLLQMAYAHGLLRLETTFTSVTDTMALAQCTAVFANGRVVTDVADSSPGNVGAKVRLHWVRLAATRAAARALRNALAIDMCSLEELEQGE